MRAGVAQVDPRRLRPHQASRGHLALTGIRTDQRSTFEPFPDFSFLELSPTLYFGTGDIGTTYV